MRPMRHWTIVAFVLAFLAAGCATGPTLRERLAPLVGATEAELIAALGVPARTYETDGLKFLQYERRRIVVYPGDPLWYGPWGPWGGWSPPTYGVSACDVTFALRQGKVEGFTYRGSCA